MRTRQCGAVALTVLLLAAAAPAWAAEIVLVRPSPEAAAVGAGSEGCDCGWSCLTWVWSLFRPKCCKTCVCIKRDCHRACCLAQVSYYGTQWRYLPSDADVPPEPPAPKATNSGANSGAELLPHPMTENNRQPPSNKKKEGNNNLGNKSEGLPQPRNDRAPNNNTGMLYVPVYVYPVVPAPAGYVAPASHTLAAPAR